MWYISQAYPDVYVYIYISLLKVVSLSHIPIGSMGLVYSPTFTLKITRYIYIYTIHGSYLEDGLRVSKWLGSPLFISHLGHLPYLGDLLTMVINHVS